MTTHHHHGDNIGGDKFGGDQVNVSGSHNIGMIKSQSSVDPQAALREMISAVNELRGQVSAADREVIDESLNTIRTDDQGDRKGWRQALGNIAGIAAMVGEVGAPAIGAVRKVMAAFGLA